MIKELLCILLIVMCSCMRQTPAESPYPAFNGKDYSIVIHHNKPYFTKEELHTTPSLTLSPLDALSRAQKAMVCTNRETLNYDRRGSIGHIQPSGWHTVRYDDLIEDHYLYNRCHLCGFLLYGEETNDERNLITGTRHFNADQKDGMLHYEREVSAYLRGSSYHVMVRVTPYYTGRNLVADGVLYEAQSVEDEGRSFSLCVFIYNEQPGIKINHRTGESSRQ